MSVIEKKPVIVTPLGGLGEVGMNIMAVEYGDEMIIIDCGLTFPNADTPGVDLIIPDIQYLSDKLEKLKGIFLTHGHEDHIGALPYIWPDLPVPIYGTAMTLGMVENKFREHRLWDDVQARLVKPRQVVKVGCFSIEYLQVTHSIVDGCALAITTPAGVIIHTGDFKIDHTPVDGRPTDLFRFAQYGENGVLGLLSDSTNVEVPGSTVPEREVGLAFDRLFHDTQGLLVVASFSSNIPRIQQIFNSAHRVGRKVVLNGRSIVANVKVAQGLGYLDIPDGLLVDVKEFSKHPRNKMIVVSTGSQGEPNSSLVRIALRDHREITLLPNDTVIFSSRFIPGNERAIGALINLLHQQGVQVIHSKMERVHVSGHAPQEDLKMMLALTRPRFFLPIHGEARHLTRHRQLALEMGIPPANAVVAENGNQVAIGPERIAIVNKVHSGRVFVDGKGVGDVGDIVLRDRRNLSEYGMVVVVLTVDKNSGEILLGPELLTRGVVYEDASQDFLEEAKEAVRVGLAMGPEALGFGREEPELKDQAVRALRRFFKKSLGRRPVILPLVMEM